MKRSEPPVLRAVKKIEFFANEWYAFKLSKWVKAKKGAAEEGNFTSQRLGADVKGWCTGCLRVIVRCGALNIACKAGSG